MKRLAPNLFDRRFGDFMEMGRARLPGLAPDWTDYNAHDPGITLMELLAWVAEAQLYSLGRDRRDEREAYAALMGLAERGTEPARGLIWPDRLDPRSPGATFAQSVVIAPDAVINMVGEQTPTFRPAAKLLWVAGRVRRLTGRLADGKVKDYTVINERGGPAFQPFGTLAGKNDRLVMEFECGSDRGLFPPARKDADGALWSIGVRVDQPLTNPVPDAGARFALPARPRESRLTATLVTKTGRIPLPIASDTSDGLLRTGALLLDLSAVSDSPREFSLELRVPQGFERPPRLLRIEPNVVPVVQGRPVEDEGHTSTGVPDWTFDLDVPGLRFALGETPVKIELREPRTNRRAVWRAGNLADRGPSDEVFELDAVAGRITFGNGLNGKIPPSESTMLASYAVCDGDSGSVAANRKWSVQGYAGSFGVNVDAISGGAAATGWIDERREARRRAREDHALVSAADIVSAARNLPLLEVARAWVLTPDDKSPRTGVVALVAMRARKSEEDAGDIPETPRWLEAIRRRLVAKMPLATRLVVTGPQYVEFSLRAAVEVEAGRDPADVKRDIELELKKRLALVGDDARHPGAPVTNRDVAGWIRIVPGVRGVNSLRLVGASGADVQEIAVPRNGLPRFDLAGSKVDVIRSGTKVPT
ncbi:putative baseplate assembly protein [Variovorax sp. J22R133]|uniref:putative baseplate assembly protein n=1 Tax=Variovorax brevis TaxID=3053503 RepID=UPI002576498F|nr:putative baseplate assembly protein [Variovorax sp. J22R133]MDM0116694.1 putative baseplate assembly protein [Variovorax sp. J22R133]